MPLNLDSAALHRARGLARAFDELSDVFSRAHKELVSVSRDAQLKPAKVVVSELEEGSRFNVTFAGVTLVFRFSIGSDASGGPQGRMEVYELTHSRAEPEKHVETIRFNVSGKTDCIADQPGEPELGYWMPEIAVQLVEKVQRSRD